MSESLEPHRRFGPPQLGLVALALISVVPPLLYYRAIGPFLDSTRIGGGLLPGPFLLLRLFAHASALLVAVLVLAAVWSFIYHASARELARSAVLLVVVFDFLYLCYALFMIAVMFATRDI